MIFRRGIKFSLRDTATRQHKNDIAAVRSPRDGGEEGGKVETMINYVQVVHFPLVRWPRACRIITRILRAAYGSAWAGMKVCAHSFQISNALPFRTSVKRRNSKTNTTLCARPGRYSLRHLDPLSHIVSGYNSITESFDCRCRQWNCQALGFSHFSILQLFSTLLRTFHIFLLIFLP